MYPVADNVFQSLFVSEVFQLKEHDIPANMRMSTAALAFAVQNGHVIANSFVPLPIVYYTA